MYNVDDLKTIYIGRKGEENVRDVEIDVRSLVERFPDAEITLLMQRNGDDVPYLCDTDIEDGIMTWHIRATDVAIAGYHPIEFRAAQENRLYKSKLGMAHVEWSLANDMAPDAPTAIQTWIDRLSESVAWAERLENVQAETETLGAGEDASVDVSQTEHSVLFTFGIPQGVQGPAGPTGPTGPTGLTGPTGNGIASVAKTGTSGLTDTYTITFTNGNTTSFTVINGEDGDVTAQQLQDAFEQTVVGVELNETEDALIITFGDESTTEIPVATSGADLSSYHWYFDTGTGMLHMYDENDDDVLDPVWIGGGGGGGGSGITLDNVVRPSVVRNGANAIFSFDLTSSDDTDITVRWSVDGVLISTTTGISGATHTFNAKGHLRENGTSTVRAQITSEGGGSLTRTYDVTSVAFSLSWSSAIQPIMLYTANEAIYAVIDVSAQSGTTNTVTVSAGGNSKTVDVTGSRSVTVELPASWFETGANTVTAGMVSGLDPSEEADEISFVALWGYGAEGPIVSFAEDAISCTQYDTVQVRYFVYDPDNETAEAEITIGEDEPRTVMVGRSVQVLRWSPQEAGVVTITLEAGENTDSVTVTAAQSQYNIGMVTGDQLRYILDPEGHSNTDADREQFAGLTFSTGFDWVNGGFQTDADGAPAFVVKKGHRATLPRSLFSDSDANGKTIDISFRAVNSDQYNAVAMTDTNNGVTKGITLRANDGEIYLDNAAGQAFRYFEETRIDLSLHVEDNVAQRVMTVWLDGIPSAVNPYTAGMLTQSENMMVIGGDHCDVWVYMIRCYNSVLDEQDMIQNYISLGSTTAKKVERCIANDIFDQNRKITPATLHAAKPDLTIIEIAADRMTVSKKDPVPADVTITDGTTVLELPRASASDAKDGCLFKVQGTSSVAYARSALNMDLDFKGTGKKYRISSDSIAVNYLNIKVNVASSENANNVCAVDWYNTYQPFVIDARKENPAVRDSVEGKPCAVFFTNTGSTGTWVSSQYVEPNETILYVMGDLCNSKKNLAVFGEDGEGEHPTLGCIEVSGNDTEPQRFRSTAAVYNPEDGEWQTTATVDGKTVKTVHYEWRMEPDDADTDTVVDAWDDAVAWVVSTIGNSAKFAQELHEYFTPKSMLYHFLMLEYFAAYDNVSKNTFYSYDWDEDENGYRWNIKEAYDWDTILAYDNDGKPLGDYGIDYGDTQSGKSYFNAVTNTIWANMQDAMYNELSALYITLRSAGAWDSGGVVAKWDNYQAMRPHAAMVRDAYIKYIYPYKTTGVVIDGTTYGYDDNYLSRMAGSKTYQRRQFMNYQTDYMDGKYGYYSKSNSTQFRTNGETGTQDFTVKAYAKTYITMIADNNVVSTQKVQAGGTVTFTGANVGNNTTLYVTPDRLVQYIRPLNETDNSTFAASGAMKLMEAILGGETANTSWQSGTGVNIPSPILKELSIRNMTHYSSGLDMSANTELEALDTRGTNAGRITLPSYAPIRALQLNACTAITADHLTRVETFSMADGDNLIYVKMDACNALMMNAIAQYLQDSFAGGSAATRSVRLTGVDWTLEDTTLLNCLLEAKAIDASGETGNAPCVLTGQVYVPVIRSSEEAAYAAAWPELEVTYGTYVVQHAVTFKNWDDTTLYVEYVDQGSDADDPVEEGYIETPERESTAQYTYAYTGWDTSLAQIAAPKTVTAVYTPTLRSYTVRWLNKGGAVLDSQSVQYGTEAVYAGNTPVYTQDEGFLQYSLWKGMWDKSTACVTGAMDVTAVYDTADLSQVPASTEDMTAAYVYGLRQRGTQYLRDALQVHDRLWVQMGYMPEYSNVESWETQQALDFDGVDDYTDTGIDVLKDGIGAGWTIAIDMKFTTGTDGAVIASLWQDTGYMGFKIRYGSDNYNTGPCAVWGADSAQSDRLTYRTIYVLRHAPGSRNVYVYNDNLGSNSAPGVTELTKAIDTMTDRHLILGCDQTDAGQKVNFAEGTVYKVKVWYADIGHSECVKIAAFPGIRICEDMSGYGSYKLTGENAYTQADFIAANSIDVLKQANSTATNAGGYAETQIAGWMEGRVYGGMPEEWRQIVRQVEVPYLNRKTDGTGEILTTDAHVFIPSLSEIVPQTSEPQIYEGPHVPWLTTAGLRSWHPDAVKRTNAQMFQQGTDPALVEANHVEDGDIWRNSSAGYGVYIRHKGGWVLTNNAWLRTADLANAERFMVANSAGGQTGQAATSSQRCVLRFSI